MSFLSRSHHPSLSQIHTQAKDKTLWSQFDQLVQKFFHFSFLLYVEDLSMSIVCVLCNYFIWSVMICNDLLLWASAGYHSIQLIKRARWGKSCNWSYFCICNHCWDLDNNCMYFKNISTYHSNPSIIYWNCIK